MTQEKPERRYVEVNLEEALAHRQRAGYSDAVLKKAEKVIEAGKLVQVDETGWTVVGSADDVYSVSMPETDDPSALDWITCSCPNGSARTQPNCYHAAAVMLSVTEPGPSLD